MYLNVSNREHQRLINLDFISRILPRPKDDDPRHDEWEVAVFFEHIHRFPPSGHNTIWAGTYDVIFRGSEGECRDYVHRLNQSLPESIDVG